MPRRLLAGVALGLCAVSVAACSGADKPSAAVTSSTPAPAQTAREILDASLKAVSGVESLQVKGALTEDGQKNDMQVTIVGKDSEGTFSMPFEGKPTVKFQTISKDGQVYLKGKELFSMVGGKGFADQAGDRWILASEAKFKTFAEFFTRDSIVELLKAEGQEMTVSSQTFEGKPVHDLSAGQDDGHLYIAAEGEPLPVAVLDPDSKVTISFTYGVQAKITAPVNPLKS